jgi:protein-S-isoprenylcysteine O-methyltransferase Ste14
MAERIPTRWVVPALFASATIATAAVAAHEASHALAHPGARPLLEAVYGGLRTLISAMFAYLTVGRAPARRRARNPIAFLVCAVAMGMVLLFQSPPHNGSATLEVLGEAVAVAACGGIAVTVRSLGRCFGVLPEARGLVTTGPYALVRHPLYLTELAAFAGLTIAAPVPANVILLVTVLGAQYVRMRFEERALTDAFPEYERYARSVPALMPSPSGLVARARELAKATGNGNPGVDPSRT